MVSLNVPFWFFSGFDFCEIVCFNRIFAYSLPTLWRRTSLTYVFKRSIDQYMRSLVTSIQESRQAVVREERRFYFDSATRTLLFAFLVLVLPPPSTNFSPYLVQVTTAPAHLHFHFRSRVQVSQSVQSRFQSSTSLTTATTTRTDDAFTPSQATT